MLLALSPLQANEFILDLLRSLFVDEPETIDGNVLHVYAPLLGEPSHAADPSAFNEGLSNADISIPTMRDAA